MPPADPQSKRSNAPPFWLLFGVGGMLAALVGVGLVLATGIVLPLGIGVAADALSYDRVSVWLRTPLMKGIAFIVATLFLWHAAHRLFHSLHDLGIRAGWGAGLACYGTALAATLFAAWALARL